MNFIKNFLLDYCNNFNISGYEYLENNKLIDYFKPFIDNYEKDNLGSLIFKSNGTKNIDIMLAAHMDEIGLIVKDIHDDGFISISAVGGINPISLVAQEVIIFGKEKVYGVIGIKPPHLTTIEERQKSIRIEQLYIDTGYSKNKLSKIISIGDIIGIKQQPSELKNNHFTSRSLDDKAGIAVMLETARELSKIHHKANVFYTATCQEEVGLRGASTSSFKINPDFAIVIDVGFGYTPELNKADTMELNEGPGIVIGANAHPLLNKKIIEVANKYNFKFQYEVNPGSSGTDAAAIQVNRLGIPCVIISLPLRYMHTSVETIDINDIENSGRLIAKFINELDNENLEELLCF